MIKHCTKCRRRWIVSVRDKRSQYICPECEGDYQLYKLVDGVAVPALVWNGGRYEGLLGGAPRR